MGAGGCRLPLVGIVLLARGVGVAKPESVPRGRVEVVLRGVGSITFVRLGRGDEGSEGGSWAGRGVSDIVYCYLPSLVVFVDGNDARRTGAVVCCLLLPRLWSASGPWGGEGIDALLVGTRLAQAAFDWLAGESVIVGGAVKLVWAMLKLYIE